MTDTPWTPGPWRVCTVDANDASWFEIQAKTRDGGFMLVATGVDADSDARLMSAAPDLYAALAGLLAIHQAQPRETTPEEIAAEYALAKAKGATT